MPIAGTRLPCPVDGGVTRGDAFTFVLERAANCLEPGGCHAHPPSRVQLTRVHNYLRTERGHMMYLDIGGGGDPVTIAIDTHFRGTGNAVRLARTLRGPRDLTNSRR